MPKQLLSHIKNFSAFSAKISLIFLFLFSATETFSQNIDLPALSPKLIAQKTLPSIVILVLNNGDNLPITTGSGFFVTEDTIVTNYHVIKNAKLGAFKIYGSDEVYSVLGTVGVDAQNDLALLKVKGVKGKPLKMNGTYQISIGDEVFTVSSPKGLEGSFSQGLVSGLRKTNQKDLIQITAPISHGSSGGAILNNQAEVIAVAVGGIDEGQSLNFAVPVKYVQSLVAKRSSLVDLPGKKNYPLNTTSSSGRTGGQGSSGGLSLLTKQKDKADTGIKNPTPAIDNSLLKAPRAVLESLKYRIPPPTLKPNQFRLPDLIDDNLRGNVSTLLEIVYEVLPNFDKFTKGEKTVESLSSYDPVGNITKQINPDIKAYDGESIDWIHQQLTTYNPASRTRTIEVYGFEDELLLKEITTYNSRGDKITVYLTDYIDDEKGLLSNKNTFEYSDQFYKVKSCSTDNVCEVTYTGLDENGIETTISYNNKNFPKYIEKTTKENGLTIKNILYNFCHPKGDKWGDCTFDDKMAKITTTIISYDLQTNQIINKIIQIRDFDNSSKSVSKESYKYEYKYDLKGNWIEKTEKKEVAKFGETYFEPISFTERKIKYYNDPDAKPSVNKKSTVKRRKN